MNEIQKLLKQTLGKKVKSDKHLKKKLTVLQAVFEAGKLSVNELMKKLDMSFPTLNALLLELVASGLLVQVERGESIGGRKPNLYQLQNALIKVLIVKIEQHQLSISLMDNNNRTLKTRISFPICLTRGTESLPEIVENIQNYLQKEEINLNEVNGLAISMPGLVDKYSGINYSFLYENGFELQGFFEKTFQKMTIIANESKAYCLAEQSYGLFQHRMNALLIYMDWGISTGIISHGKIYEGKNGYSGEIGHIAYYEDGELCYCGKRGCLETYVSGSALVAQAQRDIAEGKPTLLVTEYHNVPLKPIHIIEAAINGDQYAIQLLAELANKLGKAIATMLQVFNPETIVLSGEFAKASSILIASIQQQVQTYTMGRIASNYELQISSLGDKAIPLGLIRYFIKAYLKQLTSIN